MMVTQLPAGTTAEDLKQTLQGRVYPNKEQIKTLESLLVWCHPRGAAEKVVTGIIAMIEFCSRVSNHNGK